MSAAAAPVRIDGDEAVGIGGDALGRATAQARQREYPLDLQAPPGGPQDERAMVPALERRVGAELQAHAGALELFADDLDGARSEDRQRRLLGRDERDLGIQW